MGQQIAHSFIKTNLWPRLARGSMLLGFLWFSAVQVNAQIGDPNARNSAAGANTRVHDAKSLADLLRSRLPKGWAISLKGERAVLERAEPIEFYEGIGVPAPSESESERREFRKDYVRRGKLVVWVWLGPRLNPEDFYPARHKNEVAVQQARMDRQDGKFMPDAQFWKQHPEYGYCELPILHTDTQSIYLDSEPKYIILAPRSVARKGHGTVRFWNKDVETECQGFFDDLAKVFQAY